MLLFVYNFLSCYNLIDGGSERVSENFNESRLAQKLHQSLLEVNAFLKSVQHNIHRNKSLLTEQDHPDLNYRNVNYPGIENKKDMDTQEIMDHRDMTTRDLFLDYGVTNVWWNDTPWKADLTAPDVLETTNSPATSPDVDHDNPDQKPTEFHPEEVPGKPPNDPDLNPVLTENKTDVRTPKDSEYGPLTTTHSPGLTTFKQTGTVHAVTTTTEGKSPTTAAPQTITTEVNITTEKPKRGVYKEKLYKLMNEKNIGYMEVFLSKFLYLVATKNETKRVIMHTKPIIIKMRNNGRFWYFGEMLQQVTFDLADATVDHEQYNALQSYAGTMYYMLKSRKQICKADVNSIIQDADKLYQDKEGDALFDRIKEFEEYPHNMTKSDRDLMESMIEDFLAPAERLKHSKQGVELFISINKALLRRLYHLPSIPIIGRNGGGYKTSSIRMPFDPEIQTPRSRRKEFHKKINIKNITYDRHRRTNTNQRPDPIDKHSEHKYERQLRGNFYMPYNMPTRRSVPTTTFQRRFNVITPAEPRVPTIRTTRTKPTPFIIPETRPTTDYKPVKFDGSYRVPYTTMMTPIHYFHQNKRDYKRVGHMIAANISGLSKRRKQKTTQSQITSYYILKESRNISQIRNKRKRFKYKKDIVRKIRDGSSYSDEEEALKVNLISAMIHGNRSFDTAEVLDDTHWKDTEDMEKGLLRRNYEKLIK